MGGHPRVRDARLGLYQPGLLGLCFHLLKKKKEVGLVLIKMIMKG